MNPFEMVVIIVALGILGMVVKVWIDSREARSADAPEHAQLEARLEQVERRLRILEEIVTSDRWELEREFRQLDPDRDA